MKKIPLVVIVGPTGVGKTDLAIRLAKGIHGEIVSADSMQIYRYMNIGTAKPTLEERQGIPHYMMDVVEPDEAFNAALFQKGAGESIRKINAGKKLPILAEGTGLYINSILYPMGFTDAAEDPEYRHYLNKVLEQHDNQYLHHLLEQNVPDTAARLHSNDTRRTIRALEVYHVTGKTMMEFRQDYHNMESPCYDWMLYGLTMGRSKLYERINKRVDRMIQSGLVKEVKKLLDMGYRGDLVSMQGLGYKEILHYLEGRSTWEEAVELLKRNTRRFAKRQLTWFQREKRIHWLDGNQSEDRSFLCDQIISDIEKKWSF